VAVAQGNPLDSNALTQAKALLAALPKLDPGQSILRLYMHWSVSPYDVTFTDYNVCIHLPNGAPAFEALITNDPRNNATNPYSPNGASHTWHRNSNALGFAVCAMEAASTNDFGAYPVTDHQIETLCAAVAACGLKYTIDVSDPACVMTHSEAAILDNYYCGQPGAPGDCRWDLARLSGSSAPLTRQEARATGDLLRGRAHLYKLALMKS
jgi:hypothetical protein